MIDSTYHVRLGTVLYRLDESVQGDHYIFSHEPMRPPNAVTVQGESSQKFQVRPDTLLWRLTDWSGGEGQFKFDAQNPNRHWRLDAVDPFTNPGKLEPGPYIEVTQKASGGDADTLLMAKLNNTLVGFRKDLNRYRTWDGTEWSASALLTGDIGTNNGTTQLFSNGDRIFIKEDTVADVHTITTLPTTVNFSTAGWTGATSPIYHTSEKVYMFSGGEGNVKEFDKAGTPPVTAVDILQTEANPFVPGRGGRASMITGNGRIYTLHAYRGNSSAIFETIPSSAAGTGFSREIVRLTGFFAEGMVWVGGFILLFGYDDETNRDNRSILYVKPGAEWGSMGRIRMGELGVQPPVMNPEAVRMLDTALVTQKSGHYSDPNRAGLFLIDTVSGGHALVGIPDGDDASVPFSVGAGHISVFEGAYFFSYITSADLTCRQVLGEYQKLAGFTSPWHDFDVATEKIFTRLEIEHDPLPADWTIFVDYRLDDETAAWTTAITNTTDSTVGASAVISTDSSTQTFRKMQVRVRMEYTGASLGPTTRPVIHGVDARAVVAEPQKVWRLVLNMYDDDSSGQKSESGAAKITNIVTLADTGSVVNFEDGYQDRRAGEFSTHDVVIDSYNYIGDRPGEGAMQVVLREVN